jgi:hypothetical protein
MLDLERRRQPALVIYALSEDTSQVWITGIGLSRTFTGRLQSVRGPKHHRQPMVELARKDRTYDWLD